MLLADNTGLAPLRANGPLKTARRIVVKVGSILVTNEGRGLDEVGDWPMERAARGLGQGRSRAHHGEQRRGGRGHEAPGLDGAPQRDQRVASRRCGRADGAGPDVRDASCANTVCGSAQVLLTHADLADRERYLNARSTLLTLLQLGVVPVINENDTVVNDEIKFGDNDTLGALVANLVEADVLVILTDQKGLYTADPRRDPAAQFVHEARAGDPLLETMAGGAGSGIGKGGMITKILAAKRAAGSGASTVIAWGREPQVLLRLCEGEAIGTCLVANTPKNQARKRWMSDHLQLRGAVLVDDGAVGKIVGEGKSLLPIGMTGVEGDFSRGDVIAVRDGRGLEVARGLANYASSEARLLCRKSSADFERLLGYAAEPEMIHRDNMVLARI